MLGRSNFTEKVMRNTCWQVSYTEPGVPTAYMLHLTARMFGKL